MADAMLTAALDRLIALINEEALARFNPVRSAEEEARRLLHELHKIEASMKDAERDSLRSRNKMRRVLLSELQKLRYQLEDILDECRYAILKHKVEKHPIQKVCSFIPSSLCFSFNKLDGRHDIAKKKIDVKAKFSNFRNKIFGFWENTIDPKADIFRDRSSSAIDLAEIQGRDRDRDILVAKLMNNSGAQEESKGISVLAIVGMAGLGKTTLAQLVYNDSRVEKSFELRIWVCVSHPFDLVVMAKEILESVEKGSSPDTNQLRVLLDHVRESIQGKRFLVVLDDVWRNIKNDILELLIDSLRSGGAGGRVLVTTRDERVVKMMASRESEVFRLGLLSDDDCWSLLCSRDLSGKKEVEFEEIGKNIAKKCNGLPLAVRTLGRVLQSRSTLEEWKNVLKYHEIWQMEGAEDDIFSHFLLSYINLPYILRRCFSYCVIFPKDSKIDVENLIGNWIALGYFTDINDESMEQYGRKCFDELVEHSLLQVLEKDDCDEVQSCKMHYIVHDFAQYLWEVNNVETLTNSSRNCQVCNASVMNELSCLYCDEETPPKFCACQARLRVLSFTNHGLRSIPQGMENMIHLRWLNVTDTTELSAEDLKIIFRLYHLQSLTLLNCCLKQIPVEIGNLTHLRRLELSGNDFLMELPREIGNLIKLRRLHLSGNKSLKKLPQEIGKLIHLSRLDLSSNKSLKELPQEIGNLIHLSRLDLSSNKSLKELPQEIGDLILLSRLDLSGNESLQHLPNEIGNLIQLKHLNLNWCTSLEKLPESILALKELQTLNNLGCKSVCGLPVRVTQETGLHSMNEFRGGNGWCKLKLLNNLNHLDGVLWLRIRVDGDCDSTEVVADAREAELRNKSHVEGIRIHFDESSSSEDVMDGLQAHPDLRELAIWNYEGSKLPKWMLNPLNKLTYLSLHFCNHLTSLPPFGKLPCLEEVYIDVMESLETVGREFLGLATGEGEGEGGPGGVVVFPKLKTLELRDCGKWTVWEDIAAEEEESSASLVMPCLTKVTITGCNGLTMLPHRLLRKASSLETLCISLSTRLVERYEDMDGSDWKSISKGNSLLQLVCYS